METDLVIRAFIIIKGFIDAKDERGNAIFGTVLSLVSRREMKYLSVMFSHEESIKSISWNELLDLHKEKMGESERDPMMIRHEDELYKFLQSGNTLNNVAKNRNTKQAEQSISRHCLDELKLKTVSFIEYSDAMENDMAVFEYELEHPADKSNDETGQQEPHTDSSETDEKKAEKSDEPKAKEDIVIRCEPILAPVGGVPMNELRIGDVVMVQLPEDSVFFKLLSRNIEGFDGVVSAGITGILQNELGTATISLSLAEGVTGVIKLSGKVRIKMMTSPTKEHNKKTGKGIGEIPPNFIFGIAVAVIMIAALAVLYYIFW